MANSLTDWLAAKVSSCVSPPSPSAPSSTASRAAKWSLLDDVAFVKGSKVQILCFFTPQRALEAGQQLPIRGGGGGGGGGGGNGKGGGEGETDGLWAVVTDRVNSVHVCFSQACLTHFNSTKSRELISLRGAIIALKSFRPGISLLPSLLESNRRSGGPFAPLPAIQATLFLQVESLEVLGSINEVVFWQTGELQKNLFLNRTETKSVRKWFRRAEKLLMREQKRHKRAVIEASNPSQNNDGDRRGAEASQSTAEKSAESAMSGSTTGAPSTIPPPPFQRPVARPSEKRRGAPASEDRVPASLTQQKRAKLDAAWGDFRLSQVDGVDDFDGVDVDEFGLDAAATQLLQSHGRDKEPPQDTLIDSFFPPSPSGEAAVGGYALMEEQVGGPTSSAYSNRSSPRSNHSSGGTLPATYPQTANQASSSVCPPIVTDSTSLPFSSFLVWQEESPTDRETEDGGTSQGQTGAGTRGEEHQPQGHSASGRAERSEEGLRGLQLKAGEAGGGGDDRGADKQSERLEQAKGGQATEEQQTKEAQTERGQGEGGAPTGAQGRSATDAYSAEKEAHSDEDQEMPVQQYAPAVAAVPKPSPRESSRIEADNVPHPVHTSVHGDPGEAQAGVQGEDQVATAGSTLAPLPHPQRWAIRRVSEEKKRNYKERLTAQLDKIVD